MDVRLNLFFFVLHKFPPNAQALPEAEQRRIAREQTDTQRRNEQALQAIQQSISPFCNCVSELFFDFNCSFPHPRPQKLSSD